MTLPLTPVQAQQRLYSLLQSVQEQITATAGGGGAGDQRAELMRRQQQAGLPAP